MILKKCFLAAVFVLSVCITSALSQTVHPTSASDSQVFVPVTVLTENNLLVTALPQESFSILTNKSPRPILSFRRPDQAASVAILLDVSNSIVVRLAEDFPLLQESLALFVQSNNPANEYSLYTFGRQITQMVPWTRDRAELLSKAKELEIKKPDLKTVFFDACVTALRALKERKSERRILFILSDGGDNVSAQRYQEVKKLSYETLTTIYFINLGEYKPTKYLGHTSGLDFVSQDQAREMTSTSGGVVFAPHNKIQLLDSMQRIIKFIRCTYLLGVNDVGLFREGQQNKLRVEVTIPSNAPKEIKNLKIYYPQLYIAPGK